MAEVSAEPSMEDILSSIKRIIAEEGDITPAPRPRRPGTRAAPSVPLRGIAQDDPAEEAAEDEVLELSDPIPATPAPAPMPSIDSVRATPTPDVPEPIASAVTAQATRSALDSLSRLLVKPEPASDGTLEGLVRDMLRPMLREWIDANLPAIVETMVAREIRRITGAQG